jgi:hypothetical protein
MCWFKTLLWQILTDAYINKLVEVDGVQFDNAAIASTYYDINNDLGGATNLNLTDIDGNSVIFRTSSFANFSAKPVATGRGTVRGVLTKFGDTYQFIARSINDINLTVLDLHRCSTKHSPLHLMAGLVLA